MCNHFSAHLVKPAAVSNVYVNLHKIMPADIGTGYTELSKMGSGFTCTLTSIVFMNQKINTQPGN